MNHVFFAAIKVAIVNDIRLNTLVRRNLAEIVRAIAQHLCIFVSMLDLVDFLEFFLLLSLILFDVALLKELLIAPDNLIWVKLVFRFRLGSIHTSKVFVLRLVVLSLIVLESVVLEIVVASDVHHEIVTIAK